MRFDLEMFHYNTARAGIGAAQLRFGFTVLDGEYCPDNHCQTPQRKGEPAPFYIEIAIHNIHIRHYRCLQTGMSTCTLFDGLRSDGIG